MIGIQVVPVGEKELQIALVKAEGVFKDLRPEFELIGDEVFFVIRRRFQSEGPGWPRLSPDYAARKARKFGSKPILRATDELYGSFSKGAAGNVTRIRPLQAEFGTSDPVGMFHQEGTSRMSKRKIIEITGDDEARFIRVAAKSISERLRSIGFQVS
jgi:Phage virion morphogenesis family.